ncbi:MAG: hypothetical protein EBY28_22395, partial [Betaproteobacteria bacterium]|nr:hypothetical protein [Betaproteobacteria bacterium]
MAGLGVRPDRSNDSMSYTPGQTLESYLSEQQAGFTPQHVAAVYDIPTESNNYSYGKDAYDTTLDTAAAERDWTMARNAARAPIVSDPGYGFQDFYGEGYHGTNWSDLANIIGFKGPLYETTGYSYDPGTEIQGEVTGGRTQEGYTPTSGASYELKQALSDYAIVPKNDRGAPAVDIFDNRLELGRQMGATHVINGQTANVRESIQEIVEGAGVDVFIDNTGQSANIEMGYQITKAQGRVTLVGVPRKDNNISIYSLPLHFGKGLSGSHGGEAVPQSDIPRYHNLFRAGKLQLKQLLTETYSLDQINEAIADMRSGKMRGRCLIKLDPSSP